MEFAEIALKGALNPKVHKSRWQLDEFEKIGVVISAAGGGGEQLRRSSVRSPAYMLWNTASILLGSGPT